MKRLAPALALLAIWLGAGCQSAVLPDPNDPRDVAVLEPQVLLNSLKGASEAFMERKLRGELTEAEYGQLMAEHANELLDAIDHRQLDPKRAWEYADVFRAARRWKEAKEVLTVAVEHAKTEERRVTDTLRLAESMAHLGEVDAAIATARSVFDAAPADKAPILPAVLLEIMPAAASGGRPLELGALLEEAVEQAQQTVVDPNSPGGHAFLEARPYHVRNALAAAAGFYRQAGREDLAQAAAAKARMAGV